MVLSLRTLSVAALMCALFLLWTASAFDVTRTLPEPAHGPENVAGEHEIKLSQPDAKRWVQALARQEFQGELNIRDKHFQEELKVRDKKIEKLEAQLKHSDLKSGTDAEQVQSKHKQNMEAGTLIETNVAASAEDRNTRALQVSPNPVCQYDIIKDGVVDVQVRVHHCLNRTGEPARFVFKLAYIKSDR